MFDLNFSRSFTTSALCFCHVIKLKDNVVYINLCSMNGKEAGGFMPCWCSWTAGGTTNHVDHILCIEWKTLHTVCPLSIVHSSRPSMEDKMCYTLNPHRNSKAKEDRLDSSLASGLLCSCLVIGRSPSVLVAVQLPEDHSCCRNNRKQERKHTLSLESKNVFADTNTHDFSGSLPGRMFFVLVVQISTVCGYRECVQSLLVCACVCGGVSLLD